MATKSDSDGNSSSTSQTEISFATSNKGKQILIHENYLFKCIKKTASKKYRQCIERDLVCTHTPPRLMSWYVLLVLTIIRQIQINWQQSYYVTKCRRESWLKQLPSQESMMKKKQRQTYPKKQQQSCLRWSRTVSVKCMNQSNNLVESFCFILRIEHE